MALGYRVGLCIKMSSVLGLTAAELCHTSNGEDGQAGRRKVERLRKFEEGKVNVRFSAPGSKDDVSPETRRHEEQYLFKAMRNSIA